LAPQFLIGERWYKAVGQNLIEAKVPLDVSAIPRINFDYKFDDKIGVHGFLSQSQYDEMKKSISYHLNIEAPGASDSHPLMQAYNEHVGKAESFFDTWGLGWLFRALLYLVLSIITFLLLVIGKNLVRLYCEVGLSLKLLLAISSSWTNDCVFKSQMKRLKKPTCPVDV
jgi:hypothetical protein